MAIPRYEGIDHIEGIKLAVKTEFIYIIQQDPQTEEEIAALEAYVLELLAIIAIYQAALLPRNNYLYRGTPRYLRAPVTKIK